MKAEQWGTILSYCQSQDWAAWAADLTVMMVLMKAVGCWALG